MICRSGAKEEPSETESLSCLRIRGSENQRVRSLILIFRNYQKARLDPRVLTIRWFWETVMPNQSKWLPVNPQPQT
jgi:hypothetical protein